MLPAFRGSPGFYLLVASAQLTVAALCGSAALVSGLGDGV
jgi:hypothetical protein